MLLSLCATPRSLLTWPSGSPCPSPVFPLPISYPVAGAFAGGAAEISPFCPGSRASSMLVARQQPLAHHCNFRGWQGWYWLPFPSPPRIWSLQFPFLIFISYLCYFGDPSRISTLQKPPRALDHSILEDSPHCSLLCILFHS